MCSIKAPNNYALIFWTINLMVFFAKNMVKLVVKNVKTWALGKFTVCITDNLNMSQMGFRGYKLATNHYFSHSSRL